MRFSNEFIEEVKYRNDINEVISSYVTLKRAGSNNVGLCPFHSEKTGSFTVFQNTKTFHCFGCGAGGDVITFIMKIENLDYPGAVEFLAKRAGLQMPENTYDGGGVSRTRMYEINRAAAKFFYEKLMSSEGKEGLDYFTKKRRLSMSTIKHFGLGYSPNSFNELKDHMLSLGFTLNELSDAFLCKKSEKNGSYYDIYRNRVMFPVIDTSGNIVAFGGRNLDKSLPKYINTSDTAAFKKSRNLFGLNFAKNNCKDHLILCEGYMDVIAMHAAGFTEAVATCGTALTPDQARVLAKYTKKIILSYDSDGAGQAATKKAIDILGAAGLEVKVLKIDGAKDPDEFILKFGADRFKKIITDSVGQYDFISSAVFSKYDLDNVDDKIKAAEEIGDVLSDIYSDVERDVYIAKTAKILGVDPSSLKSDVERRRTRKSRSLHKKIVRDEVAKVQRFGDRINPDAVKNQKAANAEEMILGIILIYPEMQKKFCTGKDKIDADLFVTEFNKRIYSAIAEYKAQYPETPFDIGLLGESFDGDEMGRVSEMVAKRSMLTKNDEDVIFEGIAVLKEIAFKKKTENNEIDELGDILEMKRRNQNG